MLATDASFHAPRPPHSLACSASCFVLLPYFYFQTTLTSQASHTSHTPPQATLLPLLVDSQLVTPEGNDLLRR